MLITVSDANQLEAEPLVQSMLSSVQILRHLLGRASGKRKITYLRIVPILTSCTGSGHSLLTGIEEELAIEGVPLPVLSSSCCKYE